MDEGCDVDECVMYCLGVFPGRDEGCDVDGWVMYCLGVFPRWDEDVCV